MWADNAAAWSTLFNVKVQGQSVWSTVALRRILNWVLNGTRRKSRNPIACRQFTSVPGFEARRSRESIRSYQRLDRSCLVPISASFCARSQNLVRFRGSTFCTTALKNIGHLSNHEIRFPSCLLLMSNHRFVFLFSFFFWLSFLDLGFRARFCEASVLWYRDVMPIPSSSPGEPCLARIWIWWPLIHLRHCLTSNSLIVLIPDRVRSMMSPQHLSTSPTLDSRSSFTM